MEGREAIVASEVGPSGAGKAGGSRLLLAAAMAALGALLLAFAAGARAETPLPFWTSCDQSAGAGAQCNRPGGIATSPINGHVFVADGGNERIDELTAWGLPVRSWGWDVVQSGPDDSGAVAFEICTPENHDVCQAGVKGPGAGQFALPRGVATDSAGDVYVVDDGDPSNARVQKFSPEGHFLRMWGGGVVSGGAGGSGDLNGTDTITNLKASAKAFAPGQTITSSDGGIPPDTTVLAATTGPSATLTLSRPATTSASGVTLTAAAGAGNKPLNEQELIDLHRPTAGTFTLTIPARQGYGEEKTDPIAFDASANAGPESVKARLEAEEGMAGNVEVSGPDGGPYAVEFKGALADTNVAQLKAGSSGFSVGTGTQLGCEDLSTGGANVTYQWLANGVSLGSANGAQTPTYTVQGADAGKAIQCQVVATNKAADLNAPGVNTGTTQISAATVVPPGPSPEVPVPSGGAPELTIAPAGTFLDGTGTREVTCNAGGWTNSPSEYTYQWYRNGAPFGAPVTSAATSTKLTLSAAEQQSPAAFQCMIVAKNAGGAEARVSSKRITIDPYRPDPVEASTNSTLVPPAATPSTTIEGAGAPEICLAGEDCVGGVRGAASGQFGKWPPNSSFIAVDTAGSEAVGDDRVFVGDGPRIQRFDTEGEYEATLPDPDGVLAGKQVMSLAVVPGGSLFAATGVETPKNVVKLNSSTGKRECEASVLAPRALAADAAGNAYVVSEPGSNQVLKLDTNCKEVSEETIAKPFFPTFPFASALSATNGIAIGATCWSPPAYDLYLTNTASEPNGFSRAYGPPPDRLAGPGEACAPPPHAPEIEAQGAVSVESDRALVRAKINPQFWEDTTYYVQYGTAACIKGEGWSGACVKQAPSSPAALGAGVSDLGAQTAKVLLGGLVPASAYRYRFVSLSSGGGPVFGVGGSEAEPEGEDAGFTTNPLPVKETDSCPNRDLRSGDSGLLPDCRAYEMVSPVDKNGGNIRPGKDVIYTQATPEGEKIAYTSVAAFGDEPSNKVSNEYLASRGAGAEGWSTHGINLPLGQLMPGGGVGREVEGLTADLCTELLVDQNAVPIDPSAPAGYVNLYRQDLCGGGGAEALIEGAPPAGDPNAYVNVRSIQGFSADGKDAFLTANAPLSEDAAPGAIGQIYESTGGALRLVSVLADGAADPGSSNNGAEVGGGFAGNLESAVSEDGSRVYWTSGATGGIGTLYLRRNPAEAESEHLHGVASGRGDLIGKAKGTGNVVKNSATIKKVKTEEGGFAVGQAISGEGIAAETTILAIETEGETTERKLTLSKPATASKTGATIVGEASEAVSNVEAKTGAFEAGADITGPGIPAATTILAVEETAPGVFKLTLSAKATQSIAGAALAASSECTEADKACTLPVSSSNQATFWAASSDGSQAIFSEGPLDNETGPAATLYRFSEAQPQAPVLIAGGVRGVLGASKDLSRVYFVSNEVLTGEQTNGEGDPAHPDKAQPGEPNLYLDEEGTMTFIGTLRGGAKGDVRGVDGGRTYRIASRNPQYNAARVSADGAHIAFESRAELTHFDNTDTGNGDPSVEVFTYEAGGALRCVSCDPSGQQPSGRELPDVEGYPGQGQGTGVRAAAWIPAQQRALHSSRLLSANGKRLFFNSNVPLVPRDTNATGDVYEWEAPGEGGCSEESPAFHAPNGGCLYLISSGDDPFESEFIDASAGGRDVFFITAAGLLPQDTSAVDLYDARVGGGFAPSAQRAECEGEACQSPPGAPNDPTPASTGFDVEEPGPGCRKGQVRRGGRCVAKRQKKKHKAKRSGRRGAHSHRSAR